MTNVVNLNKFRKKKARADKEKRAETNRRLHGRTKAERARDALRKRKLSLRVEGAKLEREPSDELFHIVSSSAWEAAQRLGRYAPPSLSSEGFIHLSEPRQWLATARRFYAGQAGLVLLCIVKERLEAALKYEPADGDEFPHLYGALNLAAVKSVFELSLAADGEFVIPLGAPTTA